MNAEWDRLYCFGLLGAIPLTINHLSRHLSRLAPLIRIEGVQC